MSRKIQHICLITPKYPTKRKPADYPFVDQLACAFCDAGVNVTVITPYNALREKDFADRVWERITPQGRTIRVIQPAMLSFSSRKVLGFQTGLLTDVSFLHAVKSAIRRHHVVLDVLYGHFLVPAGTCVSRIGKVMGKPSFCAFGESSLWSLNSIGIDTARKNLRKLTGIVSVSSHNRDVLLENQLISKEKIAVFPNGVDLALFTPGNKARARECLGLPQDEFIGIYTGSMTYAKGSMRVQNAVNRATGIKMIYLGDGLEQPSGENILFCGKVKHDDIPVYMQAADFFVLPTLEEGCCNAIVEAMACGLPIISSNRPFNSDIINDGNALLIDPLDEDAIFQAIMQLRDDENLRDELSRRSIENSKARDVHDRAANILHFMQDSLSKGG